MLAHGKTFDDLDQADRLTLIGLVVECPYRDADAECPFRELRALPLRRRMQDLKAMSHSALKQALAHHRACSARRDTRVASVSSDRGSGAAQ